MQKPIQIKTIYPENSEHVNHINFINKYVTYYKYIYKLTSIKLRITIYIVKLNDSCNYNLTTTDRCSL